MKTISLCMIVKNEENNLKQCLESVKDLVDEIIIVDTGSTDNTISVANEYTDKVYDFNWKNNFSDARNLSFKLATKEYILWLDADDIIDSTNLAKLMEIKKCDDKKNIDGYAIYYNYRHDSNGLCTYSFYRDRLFKNDLTMFYWTGNVHEELHTDNARIVKLKDIHVTHTSNHNNGLKYIEMYERLGGISSLTTRDLFYFGGELVVFGKYKRAIPILEEYIARTDYKNYLEERKACEYLGDAYYNLDDNKLALKYYFKYLSIYKPSNELFYKIGRSLVHLARYEEAIYYFTIINNIHEIKDDILAVTNISKTDIWLQLSLAHYYNGDIASAKEFNDLILSVDPTNSLAIRNAIFYEVE